MTYGIVVGVIVAIGALALLCLVIAHRFQSKLIIVVLFWVLIAVILAMIPMITPVTVYCEPP